MHSDYEGGIVSKAKYIEFRARAVQSELAREARNGQENRLVRVWQGLQAWATTLIRSRHLSKIHQEWNMPTEASLRK